jgi:hypothetical protein
VFAVHPPLPDYIQNHYGHYPRPSQALRATGGHAPAAKHEAIATSFGCCYAVAVRPIDENEGLCLCFSASTTGRYNWLVIVMRC